MANGIVKKIFKDKLYGYIAEENSSSNIDFKFTFKSLDDIRGLDEGTKVSFDPVVIASNNKIAKNIKPIKSVTVTASTKPNNQTAVNNAGINTQSVIDLRNKILIPKDTISKLQLNNIENFSLLFNKYSKFSKDEKFELTPNLSNFYFPKVVPNEIILKIEKAAKEIFGNHNKSFQLKTNWRMAIGLGTESVYETGMTLHHIYGIPYIPGQALKGIVRSWIIKNYFNNPNLNFTVDSKKDDPCEIAAFENKTFCQLFGCPEYAYKKGRVEVKSALKDDYMGSIVFFDSFPTYLDGNTIKLDIMNPHYGPYYSEGKPPADYYNPVPVNFLTVQDTEFKFVLGIKEEKNVTVTDFDEKNSDTLLNIAEKYLKEALKEMGVGAKTAVGYGYFS